MIEVAGERLAFTHPLLASTVYSKARAPRRRELHRLLAEVIDDEEQRAYITWHAERRRRTARSPPRSSLLLVPRRAVARPRPPLSCSSRRRG